ncbi:MAG: hypothetical protein EHM24_05355 [Acidobacteria bacterium]|nr:MAG: hypothetical protein EHM24_15810 [Acidobacteriota bacterium]RPJ74848.1 MAG: hypothetical protein EHM24_05355 [Acidobacteriota bacterium]
MTRVEAWLKAAVEDGAGRGLEDVRPLLEGLARATRALRAAPWNERAISLLERRPAPVAGNAGERDE